MGLASTLVRRDLYFAAELQIPRFAWDDNSDGVG